MYRRIASIACFVLCLAGPSAVASVQVTARVYELSLGDWRLCERDGSVCLVHERWASDKDIAKSVSAKWYVSAPTVQDAAGKLLAADISSRDLRLYLATAKGPHAEWTFDIEKRYVPSLEKVSAGVRLMVGISGFRFRIQLAEGKYKGWYVAADEVSDERKMKLDREPVYRKLRLARDRKAAAVFRYVETSYGIR